MSITASERLDQIKVTVALFNAAPGAVYLTNFVPFAGNTGALITELVKDPAFTAIYPTYLTDREFAGRFIDSLIGGAAVGGANPTATIDNAKSYYAARLAAGETRAQVAQDLIHDLGITSESDAVWGNVAKQFNNKVAVAEYYSVDLHGSATNVGALQAVVAGVTATTPVATAADKNAAIVAGDSTATPGQVLKITAGTSGTADVLGLTGDQDVRIDFTNPANQIKGLDLNGDGVIANDGKENVITGKAANYEIVDAYSRNPLNELDRAHNFLGDIAFDGTGFQGDGINTDGNIVLGGLGVDTIYGGIGNDFLTSGGIASARIAQALNAWIAKGGTIDNFKAPVEYLSGGRNADFFFVELSALDSTDGSNVDIDGGTTADDNAAGITQSAQDADWLLFEGSDDDEPTTITLRDDSTDDVNENFRTESGSVVTRSGKQVGTLKDIENFDASGNLYGFLNNLSAKLGGAGVDGRVVQAAGQNNGIGSSAQLNVIGSEVANIIIGGYDNDHIEGNGGNDILLGGNLAYLINPNLLSITNDGKDELFGGDGDDHIVFEADGGIAEGDNELNALGSGNDTLWITNLSLGTKTAADLTTDGVLRFDLKAQNLSDAAGYGGADVGTDDGQLNDNQDQTNYKTGVARTTVQDFENVIATGLGAIDYDTDGTNTGDIGHTSQMNIGAYHGDLTLRGTDGVNVLYANTGNDVLEGRKGGTLTFDNTGKVTADGRDKLSGGDGLDDFIFATADGTSVEGQNTGDGVDVIHRQADLNGDNIWDGYDAKTGVGNFVQDFGVNSTSLKGSSALTVDFGTTKLDLADVAVTSFSIKIAGTTFAVADQAALAAANNATELAALVNAAFHAQDANVTAEASGNTVVITDSQGRDISDTISEGYLVGVAIANGAASAAATFAPAGTTTLLDRLIYASYEDRADGELTNDNAVLGSHISLGVDSYAQDRVVSFSADGTRIAEDQKYDVTFANLTTQDKVTLKVNGVEYTLQVGVDLDGNIVAAEDGVGGDTQQGIQAAFLGRLRDFINSFMDNDTAAGAIGATLSTKVVANDTLTITQAAYNGEETVFMSTPIVTLENLSGGQVATAVVVNSSQHEVQLLDFDGRDGKLNAENVLFIGDTGASRSILATAKAAGGALNGSDAVLVDGGANDLAGIAQNTATNAFLATNFSAHGDDLLISGAGVDTINAGTGDDRVIGSLGNDSIDGGKDYYAVQVLGEAEKRVVKLNDWEAKNVSQVAELAGLTISSVTLIDQTQDGEHLISGRFQDTLQFQQADFGSNAQFTVTLDNFTLNGSVVAQTNGGAGKVSVDVNADGVFESTTSFTNFENIRTVSGSGKAVANAGQGNDTLDVSALSTATGGISYDLTDALNEAGLVRYGTDAAINAKALAKGQAASVLASASVASVKAAIVGEQATDAFITAVNAIPVTGSTTVAGFLASVSALAAVTRPTSDSDFQLNVPLVDPVRTDYETKFIAVDGVENVIGGNGNDLLLIDETEAAKNNSFSAGLGVDRVEYRNDFGSLTAEPTITINVNWNGTQADANTDTVVSTSGRVGSTVATDTLGSVEYITLNSNTARGVLEADLLNVSNVAGSVTDYTNGQIRTSYKTNTNVQLTVEGLEQVEKVKGAAASNDTVIVGDKALFAANAGSDAAILANEKPLQFATYLDYDDLTAKQKRLAFGDDVTKITKTLNQKEYTFDLGAGGSDTVDYSKTADVIAAVVDFKNSGEQYVLVGVDNADLVDFGDRVDQLKSAENVVASQARSILDLTGATSDLKITFSNNFDDTKVSSWDANYEAGKYGREVHQIKVANALTGTSIVDTNYLDYVFVDTNTTDTTALPANARWTDIEGSDKNETVEISAYEAGVANNINLRGGNNKVTYEGTKLAALIDIVDYDANNAATTGLITVTATHTAVADDHNASTVTDPTTSADDVITSYSQQNGIATGVLTIKATRGGEDSFQFANTTTADKLYVFGGAVDATPSINVRVGSGAKANSLELIGFESVQDSDASNDVYDIVNLAGISPNLKLSDGAIFTDHDTLKVGNGVATMDGDAANIINLAGLRVAANNSLLSGNFNTLEVLDVTNVTGATITNVIGSAGLTDELVVGKLDGIASATLFESLVVTQDFLTQNGTSIVLDTTTNKVIAGSKSLNVDASLRTVSLGGIALDNSFSQDSLLTVAGNVSLSATGTGAATLIGGQGNDTITGGAGNDKLYGGQGNDTLDGGTATEVRQLNVTGVLDAVAGGSVTLTFDGDGAGPGTYAVTVTEGAEIVAGAGNDAVGAALATKVNANLAALNAGAVWNNGAQLLSATYDNSTDLMTFRFTSGVNVTGTIVASQLGDAGTFAASAETVVSDGGNGGIDTFVFESSVAKNGVDTINGFVNGVGGDVLNVSAFLGATVAPLLPGLHIADAAVGINLTGAENVGVIFNKANAQLVSSDIASAFALGKVAVENNSKAVVLVTADADGIGGGADVTNNPYNVYFVEDTDAGAGTNFAVTLVGTINSTAELTAFNFNAANFA